MSETLRPLKTRILDVDVNSLTAGKEWKHWKRTFHNYVTAFEAADNRVDRLQALTNFLSFNIFEYIDECEMYEAAIQKLDSVLMKTPNEFLLAICWLQQSKNLAKV